MTNDQWSITNDKWQMKLKVKLIPIENHALFSIFRLGRWGYPKGRKRFAPLVWCGRSTTTLIVYSRWQMQLKAGSRLKSIAEMTEYENYALFSIFVWSAEGIFLIYKSGAQTFCPFGLVWAKHHDVGGRRPSLHKFKKRPAGSRLKSIAQMMEYENYAFQHFSSGAQLEDVV